MTDGLVETLRVRGPGAARLGRVAATALPAALDRSLAGLPSARIDSLSIRLDLDPEQYDDVTLATLWADAIRYELMRHLSRPTGAAREPDAGVGLPPHADSPALSLADAVAAARAWLAADRTSRAIPTEVLAIADLFADTAMAPKEEELGELLIAVAAAIDARATTVDTTRSPADDPVPQSSALPPAPPFAPPTSHAESAAADPATSVGPVGEAPSEARRSVGGPDAAAVSAARARIAALATLADPGARAIDLDSVTSAAGLALLYPWLADVCREAVDLHPGLDEPAIRAHALAALVDPDDADLLSDPLVAFLAGATEPLAPQVTLPHADEVRESAERALASFARLLPGFGESSPDFVRSEWIRRAGLLDTDLDPARLTAATHPLDVVLSRLPYPLALFKLPWSPALMVRFRP